MRVAMWNNVILFDELIFCGIWLVTYNTFNSYLSDNSISAAGAIMTGYRGGTMLPWPTHSLRGLRAKSMFAVILEVHVEEYSYVIRVQSYPH